MVDLLKPNARLRDLLVKHEGMRLRVYQDSVGVATIGVGRNLETIGVTELEANLLLSNDIERINREAVETFAWFKSIDTVRQDVVLSMLFNMGLKRFQGFTKLIEALSNQNYGRAAVEMQNSLWAVQVKMRATELTQMMLTGRYAA